MDLSHCFDETLRRRPGPLPAPVLTGWPDRARRLRNAVRAWAASAVSAHRARASRARGLRQLERLDDRLLLDIGVQPGEFRRAAHATERHAPPDDERHHARTVFATDGKLA